MLIRYFQKGFNYSEDGPGNRLVIHLQGCNLSCPWCSNPEGMTLDGGTDIESDALASEIISCKRLFFDGGGVTFTGGECTLQKNALHDVLTRCKECGVHTAIETNGTCSYDSDLFDKVDLIICDFKHYNTQKLETAVGRVGEYKKNIRDYIKSGKPVVIRIILVNGFNSEREDAENFAKFFSALPTESTTFEFLPYHEYGKVKWLRLGRKYRMENAFVSSDTVRIFEEIFKSHKLKTVRS